MSDNTKMGSKYGMELRDGKIAEVGSTDRIKQLNKTLHAGRPNLELQRTRVFTDYFKANESQSHIMKRYSALGKVYETLPITIFDGERLLGWQGAKVRASNFAIEVHAHWLEGDLPTFDTRDFDPWQVTEAEKKELLDEHIPYWRDKTLNSELIAQGRNPLISLGSGYTDASNYASNPGSHFCPDMRTLFKIGFKGYAEKCEKYLSGLDETLPENVGKREFYVGLLKTLEGIRKYGERLAEAAYKEAESCTTERAAELRACGDRAKKITFEPPEDFAESLQLVWIVIMLLNIEASGPAIGLGRFDQYMWPILREDLNAGKLTVDEAMEWMEEFNIKITNIPWLLPENLARFFGGYFRWAGYFSVGGVDKNGDDAVNLLSHICLRALRYTRTTGPGIHALISKKNPDSYLKETIKLSAAGLGHPAYFESDSVFNMLKRRAAGLDGKIKNPDEMLREFGCITGCVEPYIEGRQHGHSNANLTNVGNTLSVTLNNGVLPRQCPGYGAGTKIGLATGDPRDFKTFEELYDAVYKQFKNQVDECHANLLICEKLTAEEHQMPLSTLLIIGTLEKAKDYSAGGADFNIGPAYMLTGIADLADSMMALKQLIFDEKKVTMDEMLKALDADFEGYEDIRKMCLDAPKYGNDIDEVDNLIAKLLKDFSDYVRTKQSWRAENAYSDLGIQPAQANVGNGALCWALPNGRKGLQPFADAMSCEQGKDVNGPLATIRSYGKIDHSELSNGTLLNMWISSTELVNEF